MLRQPVRMDRQKAPGCFPRLGGIKVAPIFNTVQPAQQKISNNNQKERIEIL
jgi:hypothetical protein